MDLVVSEPVANFGDVITELLLAHLGPDLVGVYFVGSLALGGYVPGESDLDLVAVCEGPLAGPVRAAIANAVADATTACPARGLEFTLYRADIVSGTSTDAAFEVNANGGPRMERLTRISPDAEPGFWYVLDRAIACRHGITIFGAPAAEVFADLPRRTLLDAMRASMRWHRQHERATLYSVLNATRAWRFADDNVLGSKLEGAAWARVRWTHPHVIDAAVALRHGRSADLDELEVQALLDRVERELEAASSAAEGGA